MKTVYKTSPVVCSQQITIETEGNKLVSVRYVGGCNGNLQGICRLVEGMDIDEVIARLQNIRCGNKNSSCPAELAKALKGIKDAESTAQGDN